MEEIGTKEGMNMATADYHVIDHGDNGEFLTWATLALIYEGEWVDTVEFTGSSEFPGDDALAQAISYGVAFVEAHIFSIEERLGCYGIECEREQDERRAA